MMFRKLLSFDEAKQIIYRNFQPEPLGLEEVALLQAYERTLAGDVVAGLDVPSFSRSTVDGYAVKAEDTFEADENRFVTLNLCGTVNIGELPHVCVEHCTAAEIVTGAPIPRGADAVVMLEDTEKNGNTVEIHNAVARDENIMKIGSDVRKGSTILRKGQLLQAREIGVLAAVGLAKVNVYARPTVAVLSTGGEVTEPGKDLPPGRIYDINAYSLCAAVLESGGKPSYLGVFPDDKAELKKALKKALASADMVVTSGGVSVGPKDIMPQTVDSLGKPGVIVCGIAIKPGKPATIALVGGKLIFSFPGHPTSALLTFYLLARPILNALTGKRALHNSSIRAVAGMRMFPAKGRKTFVMVKLEQRKSDIRVAVPLETGQSGAITTLANADGFVEIAENQQFIDAGEEVLVQLFRTIC